MGKTQYDLRIELEKEIEKANEKLETNSNSRKRNRDEVINDSFGDDLDYDYTDTVDNEESDFLADAEYLEENFNNFAFTDEIS